MSSEVRTGTPFITLSKQLTIMEQDNHQLGAAQQVQYDGQDSNGQSKAQAQKQQEQTYFLQQDVRMKRHPELQPFVPSDRYTTFSTSSTAGSGLVNTNTKSPSSNVLGRQQVYSRNGKTQANSSSLATGQAKKFVSMTRLNQLAQPKKRLMVPSAPQSSNSSNRSINSLNRTINKTQGESSNNSRNDGVRQQSADNNKAKQQRSPQPPPQTKKDPQKKQDPRVSLGKNATAETRAPRVSTASNQAERRQSIKSQPKQQQQSSGPAQQQTSKNSQPSTPITSSLKLEPSTMMTPSSTTDLPSKTPQSSTPIARVQASPRDQTTTPIIQPPPTLTPGVSEEERSLVDNSESVYQDQDEDAPNQNQLSANSNIKRSANESSLAEQISEMSINDPFYQSAASELVPESEISTNGINFDRNTDSLFNQIEQDLIAIKGKKANDSRVSNTTEDYFIDLDKRNSTATIVTESATLQQKVVESKQKEDQEEDDRRIRIEKELREKARVEEEERKERDQIVENILSRFSQGSVS